MRCLVLSLLAFDTAALSLFSAPQRSIAAGTTSRRTSRIMSSVSWDELVSAKQNWRADVQLLTADLKWRGAASVTQCLLPLYCALNSLVDGARTWRTWGGNGMVAVGRTDGMWTEEYEEAWQRMEARQQAEAQRRVEAAVALDAWCAAPVGGDDLYDELISTCSTASGLAPGATAADECARLTRAAYDELRLRKLDDAESSGS